MDEFEQRTYTYIKQKQLLDKRKKVLVAISGGPDSAALLHVIVRFFSLENIYAVHVNHQLRPESEAEEALVRESCEKLGVKLFVQAIDVNKIAIKRKNGIEEAARYARYAFFESVMNAEKIDQLAVAHHADDQLETIMMRLIRGSFSTGWSGIAPIRSISGGKVVRPFLTASKAEILAYCERQDIPYVLDSSNDELVYMRNRLRKKVIPLLKAENPSLASQITRYSEETREDFAYLDREAEKLFSICTDLKEESATMQLVPFKKAGIPLQRRVIHLLLNYLYKNQTSYVSTQHIKQILRSINSKNPSAVLQLPQKLQVRRSYEQLNFNFGEISKAHDFYHALNLNEHVRLEKGIEIKLKTKSSVVQTAGLNGIILNQADVVLPLIIRNRMNGDRMTLKGTKGTKKVKDILIDAKVPRHLRSEIPIITDFTGKILWIPGIKMSAYAVASSRKQKQYMIRYTQIIGGSKSMHNDIKTVLISEEEIQEKIKELGRELTAEYEGRNPLAIGILKGATPFMTDLLKRIDTYLEMDFMDVSSYGNGTTSSGEVKIIKDLNASVEGRDVLIIEDIIDSGKTLSYLVDLIKYRKAKSVKLVTMLDKPEGRNVDINADYVGFLVPNEFVVGYGLDYAEKYRNLPYIGVLKPEVYADVNTSQTEQ